jgi:hypothetical protein
MLTGASLIAASAFIGRAVDFILGIDAIAGLAITTVTAAAGGFLIGYGFAWRRRW